MPEKPSESELARLYGADAAERLAELQPIIADMDADDFSRVLSFSVGLAAVRKPKTQGMRRYGAPPLAEAQIADAVALWLGGMAQAEIAANYGYATASMISSKIRIFSLRHAPERDDLAAKTRAAVALECWREKQKLLQTNDA